MINQDIKIQEAIEIVKKYLEGKAKENNDCLIVSYKQRNLLAIGKLLVFAMQILKEQKK